MAVRSVHARRRAARPVAAMLLAVALAAITSIDGTLADGGDGRLALRETSPNAGAVAAAIAAAVRELAGRRAAGVAGHGAGAAAFLALMDVAVGSVASPPTAHRPPVADAPAPRQSTLPARLLALPPPGR